MRPSTNEPSSLVKQSPASCSQFPWSPEQDISPRTDMANISRELAMSSQGNVTPRDLKTRVLMKHSDR